MELTILPALPPLSYSSSHLLSCRFLLEGVRLIFPSPSLAFSPSFRPLPFPPSTVPSLFPVFLPPAFALASSSRVSHTTLVLTIPPPSQIFTLIIGLLSFFLLPASPSQTKSRWRPKGYFTDDEVKLIVNRVIRDDHTKTSMHNRQALTPKLLWKSLCDYDLWPMVRRVLLILPSLPFPLLDLSINLSILTFPLPSLFRFAHLQYLIALTLYVSLTFRQSQHRCHRRLVSKS